MKRLVSFSLVTALVLCFAFGGVVYGDSGTAASPSTKSSLWDLIADSWNTLSKLWQEAGSSLDPFGNPPTANSDAGSHLDPFGNP